MLPVAWTVFVVLAVGAFLMIAAYWLDVQDRPDLSVRARMGWSLGAFVFPVAIPAYALWGGGDWPAFLKVASILPAIALILFFAFAFGAFT